MTGAAAGGAGDGGRGAGRRGGEGRALGGRQDRGRLGCAQARAPARFDRPFGARACVRTRASRTSSTTSTWDSRRRICWRARAMWPGNQLTPRAAIAATARRRDARGWAGTREMRAATTSAVAAASAQLADSLPAGPRLGCRCRPPIGRTCGAARGLPSSAASAAAGGPSTRQRPARLPGDRHGAGQRVQSISHGLFARLRRRVESSGGRLGDGELNDGDQD
jgi:hypothetical protein